MIPRITKGTSAARCLEYDHGPGRRDEHRNPHKVAGSVAGRDWRERGRVIDAHTRAARDEVAKPIHRTALRIAGTDRRLSDAEWKQVATTYVAAMGFAACPWEATRHADDHIHLTISRVQWDGELAGDGHDYARAQAVCRDLERSHGLSNAAARYHRDRPQICKGERESAQRRGVVPEKDRLREKILAAEGRSHGDRASFEAALTGQGVAHRANVAPSTGRVSGYSYHLEGHQDPAGEAVWMKGSQLGKEFSWTRTQHRLNTVAAAHAAATTPARAAEREQVQHAAAAVGGERWEAEMRAELARRQKLRRAKTVVEQWQLHARRGGDIGDRFTIWEQHHQASDAVAKARRQEQNRRGLVERDIGQWRANWKFRHEGLQELASSARQEQEQLAGSGWRKRKQARQAGEQAQRWEAEAAAHTAGQSGTAWGKAMAAEPAVRHQADTQIAALEQIAASELAKAQQRAEEHRGQLQQKVTQAQAALQAIPPPARTFTQADFDHWQHTHPQPRTPAPQQQRTYRPPEAAPTRSQDRGYGR